MAKRDIDHDIKTEESVSSKKPKTEDDNQFLSETENTGSADNPEDLNDTNELIHCNVLTELDVGIAEYLGDHSGFTGIIKQRFSDFLVHEIDKQGHLVELNNTSVPQDEEETDLPEAGEYFEPEVLNNLQRLSAGEKMDPLIIKVNDKSKDIRRIMHRLISKLHPNLLTSTVAMENGDKTIEVRRNASYGEASNKFQRGVRQNWPSTRGNYTSFVVYKENIDTMEVINLIAKMLGMKPGVFTYAGVKDRRAKTSQQITVYRTEAEKLLSLNRRLRNVVIGNIKYISEPLRLGDLWGNRFNIVLRNVKGTDEEIANAMKSLETKGFLNYYGMQRFGTTTVPTYKVGLALLKSDWKTAVDLILQPRQGEDENMTLCRKMWKENENPKKIFSLMKRKNSPEAHLLRGLAKHGTKDLVNALNAMPRNVRLMYVHSFQSYVWNRMLSKKYKVHGAQAVEGDLYMKHVDQCHDDLDTNNDVTRPIPNFVSSNEEIDQSSVVLPLFGHDVLYPKNEIAEWYEEILASDGLNIKDVKHRIKDYSLPGSYRSIVVKPKNVQWSIVKYDDPHISLLQSDWSQLQSEDQPLSPTNSGSLRAMKIQFDLPRSSYATMALRELLRIDTSANYQKSLNSNS